MKATQGPADVTGTADSVVVHTARTVSEPLSTLNARVQPALCEAPSEFAQARGRSRILLAQLPQGRTAAGMDLYTMPLMLGTF